MQLRSEQNVHEVILCNLQLFHGVARKIYYSTPLGTVHKINTAVKQKS